MWKAQDLKKKMNVLNIYAWRQSILKIRKTRAAEYLGQAYKALLFANCPANDLGKPEKKVPHTALDRVARASSYVWERCWWTHQVFELPENGKVQQKEAHLEKHDCSTQLRT